MLEAWNLNSGIQNLRPFVPIALRPSGALSEARRQAERENSRGPTRPPVVAEAREQATRTLERCRRSSAADSPRSGVTVGWSDLLGACVCALRIVSKLPKSIHSVLLLKVDKKNAEYDCCDDD